MNREPAALRLSNLPHVRFAAESAFQREGLPALDRFAHFTEQQPSRFKIRCGGIERRESARQLVSIIKAQTLRLMREKLPHERCFPRAAAAADEVNYWNRRRYPSSVEVRIGAQRQRDQRGPVLSFLDWNFKANLTTRRFETRKRSSCALCKPHKRGWDDKKKPGELRLAIKHAHELREQGPAG